MGSAHEVTAAAPRGRLVLAGLAAGLGLFLLPDRPARAQPPPTTSPPIWTQVPTRIDRSKDTRERIEVVRPPEPPGFVVAGDGRTDADGNLVVDGRRYRLFGLAPIEPGRLCTTPDGRRWACGTRARAQLFALVVGKTLRCSHVGDPAAPEPVVDCRFRDRSLTEQLVSAGFAELDAEGAATPSLATALDAARRAGVGVWSNAPPP